MSGLSSTSLLDVRCKDVMQKVSLRVPIMAPSVRAIARRLRESFMSGSSGVAGRRPERSCSWFCTIHGCSARHKTAQGQAESQQDSPELSRQSTGDPGGRAPQGRAHHGNTLPQRYPR